MISQRRVTLIAAICVAALVVGGLVVYLIPSNQQSVAWNKALEVRDAPALVLSRNVRLNAISCAAPGDCSAVGNDAVKKNHDGPIVDNETNGVWGKAEALTGLPAGDEGSNTAAFVVSCAAPGNCGAGGTYSVGRNRLLAFVVNETNGSWGRIVTVPGVTSLKSGDYAYLTSISCPTPGDCSAGGYAESSGGTRAFVLGVMSPGGSDYEVSVSCSRAGDCAARGDYLDNSKVTQAFLVNESKGVWGRAFAIPGMSALNGRHISQLLSISCAASGDCTAGGTYGTGSHERAFVVNEVGGTWSVPATIPGLASPSHGNFTSVTAVSCGSSGNCGAVGSFNGHGGYVQVFATNEVNGRWDKATAIGTPSFAGAIAAYGSAISCASTNSCAVVGTFFDAKQDPIPFVEGTETKS